MNALMGKSSIRDACMQKKDNENNMRVKQHFEWAVTKDRAADEGLIVAFYLLKVQLNTRND